MNLFFVSLWLTLSSQALTYEIVGCEESPAFTGTYESGPGTVGQISLEILDRLGVPYIGAERGIHSIFGTPTGEEAIEILSREEMRAYGWCFEVDGVQPALLPDAVKLKGTEHLKWFYGFAHYKRGELLSYCEPAHRGNPAGHCK